MDTLYPNLHERFKIEGLCAICLMEMELTTRYSCINGHTMCYRCKPFYHGCPTCLMPLDVEILPPQVDVSSSTATFVPHALPPRPIPSHGGDYSPSAPPIMNEFLNRERRAAGGEPPVPSRRQQLKPCSYSHLGCWVKVPLHLQTLHESRCQFRPHLEEEHLPTDLRHRHDDLVECPYAVVGCKVRTVPWRRSIHESFCIYKDRYRGVDDISEGIASARIDRDDYGDPDEMVQCKFRRRGCMVSMPRRRKFTHEQKCNYKNYRGTSSDNDEDHDVVYPCEPDFDPEELVECRWSGNGCRVRPKRCRKQIHEDKCNYRMEECTFKNYGCDAMFIPARKYAHESTCEFAN